MSTITISFAVRESKARMSGEAPIQVLLTQNGVRASFSTGKAVHPSEWDRNRQRVRSKEPEAIEINNYLDAIRARLYYLEKVLIDRDIGISPQILRGTDRDAELSGKYIVSNSVEDFAIVPGYVNGFNRLSSWYYHRANFMFTSEFAPIVDGWVEIQVTDQEIYTVTFDVYDDLNNNLTGSLTCVIPAI